jgi:hypothetical protein
MFSSYILSGRTSWTGRWARPFALLWTFAALAPRSYGKETLITIDDFYGDSETGRKPDYQPPDKWSYGPDCPGCFVQPDKSRAFRNSWHDATVSVNDRRNITLTFTGKYFVFVRPRLISN